MRKAGGGKYWIRVVLFDLITLYVFLKVQSCAFFKKKKLAHQIKEDAIEDGTKIM